jgi:Spy/CpxP family protein refolding chaperone
MRTRVFLQITLSIFLLPAIAPAQAKPNRPEMSRWWERPVVRDIGLNAEQDKQIRDIVRESRDRLIQLRATLDSAESALADEMGEDKIDPKKAEAIIDRVITARAELQRGVARMSLKIRLILTTAQWHVLEKREGEQTPPPQEQPKRKEDPGNKPRPPAPQFEKDGAEN